MGWRVCPRKGSTVLHSYLSTRTLKECSSNEIIRVLLTFGSDEDIDADMRNKKAKSLATAVRPRSRDSFMWTWHNMRRRRDHSYVAHKSVCYSAHEHALQEGLYLSKQTMHERYWLDGIPIRREYYASGRQHHQMSSSCFAANVAVNAGATALLMSCELTFPERIPERARAGIPNNIPERRNH